MGYTGDGDDVSVDKFLVKDDGAEYRLEYYDGRMIEMAGGTPDHSLISGNCATTLNVALSDRDCRVFTSDLKLEISEKGTYVYPDIMVVCGELKHSKVRDDIITNPILIIEVLSESTSNMDRGVKFHKYLDIPYLKYYLLIEQDVPAVDVYSRGANGKWIFQMFEGLHEVILLEALKIKVPLIQIYKKVRF